MTTNTGVLEDVLIKRIAHGGTTAHDLPLLSQLLVCQRRRCLLIGAVVGVGLMVVLQAVASVAL